jgi:hypothetical protein
MGFVRSSLRGIGVKLILMAWELEHPEMVGVEEMERPTVVGGVTLPATRKLALYAGLALAPVLIFVLMVLLARK